MSQPGQTPSQPAPLPAQPYPPYADDEIDLRELMRPLWRRRYRLLAAMLLGAVLVAGATLLLGKRVTEAFYQLPQQETRTVTGPDGKPVQENVPGISIADYKQYITLFVNERRLQTFAGYTGLAVEDPLFETLKGIIGSTKAFNSVVSPEFSFTSKDAKEFGVKDTGEQSTLLGVSMTLKGGEPERNARVMELLAGFIQDGITRADLTRRFVKECAGQRNGIDRIRNQEIQVRFDIEQNQRRVESLRRIIADTPQATQLDSRQVVSIDGGGARYLSPVAQLVGAEMTINDLRLQQWSLERDMTRTDILREFYCQGRELLENQPRPTAELMQALVTLREGVMEGRDRQNNPAVEEAWNSLGMELENWRNRYLDQFRFLSAPATPEKPERKMSLPAAAALGGFLGLFLGMLAVLIGHWWHSNRALITAPEEESGES